MQTVVSQEKAEKSLRFANIATFLLASFLGFAAALIPMLFLVLTMFTGGSENTMQKQFVAGAALVFVLVVISRVVLSRGRAFFAAGSFAEARTNARIATSVLAVPSGLLLFLYVLVRIVAQL